MKVLIITDLEGISGVDRVEQVDNNDPFALERLMVDVNAAIRGAFDGGATEVLVVDGHCHGQNFLPGKLDSRATKIDGFFQNSAVIEEVDALFSVGIHAMSGAQNAFYDHTQTAICWHDYFVNGRKYGELGQ